ncbi:MAG: HAMP domain-containing sensor histidine kinase [Bacteroidota bacterium]
MIFTILRSKWKTVLLFLALVVAASSFWFTSELVSNLSKEERKKIKIWADASKELQAVPLTGDVPLYLFEIIQENRTIPRILTDSAGNILTSMNLDPAKEQDEQYLKEQIELMKITHEPIVVTFADKSINYIYYKDSILLTQLYYYPIVQFFIIFLFLVVVYIALSISETSEQNRLWVGMSKETAHQLGTPISSLLAFVELLKAKNEDDIMAIEVEKDVQRLEKITERFSRIGSAPLLVDANITLVLKKAVEYLKTRTSPNVNFIQEYEESIDIYAPINIALFEWVIENLWKNALDAMNNMGEIIISLKQTEHSVFIDISDTGKGITKRKFNTIFKPGYTTKDRGWGLGLSLVKRIIESYHKGKIYVRYSEVGRGTTFRMTLKKAVKK